MQRGDGDSRDFSLSFHLFSVTGCIGHRLVLKATIEPSLELGPELALLRCYRECLASVPKAGSKQLWVFDSTLDHGCHNTPCGLSCQL